MILSNLVRFTPVELRRLLPITLANIPTKSLTENLHIDQYLEKADEVNQLNLIKTASDIGDMESLLQVDDPDLQSIAWSCIGGIQTFNGNYKLAIAAFQNASKERTSKDVKAYQYLEISNILRKLGYMQDSLNILEKAEILTDNVKLKWRIKTVRGYIYKFIDLSKAEKYLNDSLSYYIESKEDIRSVFVIKHLGNVAMMQKEYSDAESYYFKAIEQAKNLKSKYQLAIMNDLGWLYVNQEKFGQARSIFLDIIKQDLSHSPYIMCLALENLGYIALQYDNYREAAKYYSQSLIWTSKYEMSDLMFEDYYYLGLAHERLNEYGMASHFYSEGYYKLSKEINDFRLIPDSGFRKKLLDASFKFFLLNQRIPHLDPTTQAMQFAVGKTFKEIRRTFYSCLFTLHMRKHRFAKEICSTLGINERTFFLYKKKLGLKRNHSDDNTIFPSEYFQQYVKSMLVMDWLELNEKFEYDLFKVLMKEFKGNKTAIAESLKISYPGVFAKTQGL